MTRFYLQHIHTVTRRRPGYARVRCYNALVINDANTAFCIALTYVNALEAAYSRIRKSEVVYTICANDAGTKHNILRIFPPLPGSICYIHTKVRKLRTCSNYASSSKV